MVLATEPLGTKGTRKVAHPCVHYQVPFHILLREEPACKGTSTQLVTHTRVRVAGLLSQWSHWKRRSEGGRFVTRYFGWRLLFLTLLDASPVLDVAACSVDTSEVVQPPGNRVTGCGCENEELGEEKSTPSLALMMSGRGASVHVSQHRRRRKQPTCRA